MDNSQLLGLIKPVLDSIENKKIENASLYAFKSKKPKSSNKLISLEYEFYDTTMAKPAVIDTVINILAFFKNKYLDKQDTVYEEYSIRNTKRVIDYISINKLDFSDPEILNGNKEDIDSTNYKVQYFLNDLAKSNQIAVNKKDYRGLRYSAIQLKNEDETIITIINKSSPIYKVKGWLYSFNTDEQKDIQGFNTVYNEFLKLPLYPHIIIIDTYCFLIEDHVESIFGFEQFNKLICSNTLDDITKNVPLSKNSFNLIKEFSLKGKNSNLFADLDTTELNNIKKKDKGTIDFLKDKLKISVSESGEISINNDKDAENFILFICGCILRGAKNDDLYRTNKSVLLEI